MDNYKKFRKLLIDRGKNLNEVSKLIGFTDNGVRKAIRNHTLSVDKAKLIASFLGVPERDVTDLASSSNPVITTVHGRLGEYSAPSSTGHGRFSSMGEFLDYLYANAPVMDALIKAKKDEDEQ